MDIYMHIVWGIFGQPAAVCSVAGPCKVANRPQLQACVQIAERLAPGAVAQAAQAAEEEASDGPVEFRSGQNPSDPSKSISRDGWPRLKTGANHLL